MSITKSGQSNTRIVLDETALKHANPRRGARLTLPSVEAGAEAARKVAIPGWLVNKAPETAKAVRAMVASGDPPSDLDSAAGLLTSIDAFEQEELIEPVMVWLDHALGVKQLFTVLTRVAQIGNAYPVEYNYMQREHWLAFARLLCVASDSDYAAVRDDAAQRREGARPVTALRGALDMIFPSEPWATEDARKFSPGRNDGPAFDVATCLLLANDDYAIAERLMTRMASECTSAASGPAYTLVDRFGAAAEPLLIAALESNLRARHDVECEWIAGALACIGSQSAGAVLKKRLGKKVANNAAKEWLSRFGEGEAIPKEPAKTKRAARFAVIGDFDLYAHTDDDALAVWKQQKPDASAFDDWPDELSRKTPRRAIAALLGEWSRFQGKAGERLTIDAGESGVAVRGVLLEATVKARAVALAALFRLGEEAPVYFNGELVVFSPELERGIRLSLYERGESELETIDEAADLADELRALLGSR
jgi:hypothetical protein